MSVVPTQDPVESGLSVGRAIRSRNQLLAAYLGGGFFVLIGLGEIVGAHGAIPVGVVALACGLAPIYLFAVRTGFWITPTGIRVQNPIEHFALGWDEIRGFRIGRHGFFGASLLIDLHDGSNRYSFAIQVANSSLSNPNAPERRLVVQLNAQLEARTFRLRPTPAAQAS